MRCIGYVTFALLAAAALPGGPAFGNVCQTGRLTCATTMPVEGYCECTAHGTTERGTVVSKPQSRRPRTRPQAAVAQTRTLQAAAEMVAPGTAG